MSDPLRPPRVEEQPAQIGRTHDKKRARAHAAQTAHAEWSQEAEQAKQTQKGTKRVVVLVLGMVGLGVLLAVGLPFYFLFPIISGAFKQSSLRTEGIEAKGEILSVSETNTTFNDQPVIDLRLRIAAEDGQIYETSVSQPFSMLHAANLRSGAGVVVRYDPEDRTELVVVQTGTAPLSRTSRLDPGSAPHVPPQTNGIAEACLKARACCLIIADDTAQAACENFMNPQFPAVGCQTALDGLKQAAFAQGKSCEE